MSPLPYSRMVSVATLICLLFPAAALHQLRAQESSDGGRADQQAASSGVQLPHYPLDIAIDSEKTAYVADLNMHGVWQVKEGGEPTRFFEGSNRYRTPLYAVRCVTVNTDSEIFAGDTATREIYHMREGEAEPLTNGQIGIPVDLAVMADGSILVADLELRALFRIPADADPEKTDQPVAEKIADVNPRGVFVDADDQIWVVSQDEQQLLKVTLDGKITPIVSERVFEFPHQVVVDPEGIAYVTDGYGKAIWMVSPGEAPEIWFQGEPLVNPVGIAMIDGQIVVVDPRAQKVFKFDSEATPSVWFDLAE